MLLCTGKISKWKGRFRRRDMDTLTLTLSLRSRNRPFFLQN